MDKNKQLHKLLGLCWHEWKPTKDIPENLAYGSSCKKCGTHINISGDNPDYTSDAGKVQLLREMAKRKDCCDFLLRVNALAGKHTLIGDLIHIDYMIEDTGKLRDLAIKWLKKEATDG